MEFIKQWCFCVCISLCAACIFSLFTPQGSMKRFYKILISFFVFVSFLYPFHDFSIRNFKLKEITPSTVESTDNAYDRVVSKAVKTALEENGIKGVSVSARTNADYKTGEITVEKVTVSLPDEYDREKVKNIVFETLGIEAEVRGIGE